MQKALPVPEQPAADPPLHVAASQAACVVAYPAQLSAAAPPVQVAAVKGGAAPQSRYTCSVPVVSINWLLPFDAVKLYSWGEGVGPVTKEPVGAKG